MNANSVDLRARSYRIAFGELRLGDEARQFLLDALDRHWVSEGPNVRQFEQRFAQLFGYAHAIATSSGTDAGIVTMSALYDRGAERGDEVITPALGFAATANSILAAGLIPKFVDVELSTLNIDPALIEKAITPRTRAIQVVHTMGKPCDMHSIMNIAERHGLAIIEDACEAHGAEYNGQVVGTFGTAAIFSFYAAHLICSGEGGMIVTHDADFANVCRSIRTHGRRNAEPYFQFDRLGFNAKMNDLEAAVGLEGITNFKTTFTVRRQFIQQLRTMLAPLDDVLILYHEEPHEKICPHAFPLVLREEHERINGLYKYLESRGIQCKTLFGSLPTQHRAFQFLGYRLGDFPVAERIGRTGLHFGVHQYLREDDVEFIADCLFSYFGRAQRLAAS